MPRHARIDAVDVLQHVMVRGMERRNIFRKATDRGRSHKASPFLLPETGTMCYAWVFMSNHAPLRSGQSGITNFMRRILTGYVVSKLIGMTPPAVTYAVERGGRIAEDKRFEL